MKCLDRPSGGGGRPWTELTKLTKAVGGQTSHYTMNLVKLVNW